MKNKNKNQIKPLKLVKILLACDRGHQESFTKLKMILIAISFSLFFYNLLQILSKYPYNIIKIIRN